MRARLAVLPVLLVAAVPAPARASTTPPKVSRGSCYLEATNGTAACVVQLDPNSRGGFGTSTWSGYGGASITCSVSGYSRSFEGGYGSDFEDWSHGADVCRLSVFAIDGTTDAYVF